MKKYTVEDCEKELESLFYQLKNQVDLSFGTIQESPQVRKEILNLWEKKLKEFISYTIGKSQQYNDKAIMKALTKAVLFR